MKKIFFAIIAFASLLTFVYAYDRGDTVYTCHYHQDGWMWTSGSYTACEYVILEEIGNSRYRIEALDQCEGHYEGDTRIVSSNSLFSSSAIKFSKWGNKCKADYIE